MVLREAGSASPKNVVPPDEPRVGEYVVVARRYRPQAFDELIGQQHVARALKNAIAANRVGHAYLFTGARGVGKTSAARILAKALDCQFGPTATPCNECDICSNVSAGSDVDVLEIDGASNRGIDEIRQLRQNVNIRPSRARFKIYIIDEVHMLTKEAFNALLKTLEEPPEHVKFIFCTTEANKIPITILSRCQRFDFAGIRSPSIVERLKQIVEAEGVSAETAALEILARRANGSMRDSQSLLEQLLSFGGKEITAADVHALLGTAGSARLSQIVAYLIARDAGGALRELDGAIIEGVDVGQLLEQLLGYFRDCMASAVGCGPDAFLYTSGDDQGVVVEAAKQLGLETILAISQIIDHTLSRLRYSTQGRTLTELTLARIANLDDLQSLPTLLAQLRGEAPPPAAAPRSASPPAAVQAAHLSAPAAKKKADPGFVEAAGRGDLQETERSGLAEPSEAATHQSDVSAASSDPAPQRSRPAIPFAVENAEKIWGATLAALTAEMVGDYAAKAARTAILAPNRLVVSFGQNYNFYQSFCERPEQLAKLEQAASEVVGKPVKIGFEVIAEEKSSLAAAAPAGRKSVSQRQLMAERAETPIVRRATELFRAELERVEPADG